jgi:hypothetical protein
MGATGRFFATTRQSSSTDATTLNKVGSEVWPCRHLLMSRLKEVTHRKLRSCYFVQTFGYKCNVLPQSAMLIYISWQSVGGVFGRTASPPFLTSIQHSRFSIDTATRCSVVRSIFLQYQYACRIRHSFHCNLCSRSVTRRHVYRLTRSVVIDRLLAQLRWLFSDVAIQRLER